MGDVLHRDGHALERGLQGDAATHDAGADHRGELDLQRRRRSFFGLAGEILLIEENPHEIAADRALGEFDESVVLDPQGLGPGHAGGIVHELHRGRRRGIVRPGLRRHHGFGGIAGDLQFDGRQPQRRVLALADGAVVEFAGPGALDQFFSAGQQLLPGHDGVQRAFLECPGGADLLATSDPLVGVVGADEPRQADGAAEAGHNPEFHLGKPNPGVLGGDAEIGGDRKLEAAAEGETVNGRNRGKRQVFNGVEDGVAGFEPVPQLFAAGIEHGGKFGDVGANDKGRFGAGEHQALDTGLGDFGDRPAQFFECRPVELVDR